uniref:G-protein coupled receptors family 3 profile domain-containing protein n=1 Tax=Ditylum brightwellii TaxID=49249 RepID=A0A7S1ZKP5_9STRA
MASKMINLCNEGVDGLFVTIPSENVVRAIEECQNLNVPVMSVNTGAELSQKLGLIHHISQLEYTAGFGAGKRLIESGMSEGFCLNPEAGNTALVERCKGFEDALAENSIPYLGMISVPLDNEALFTANVEQAIDREGDWDGLSVLTVGASVVSALLSLKERRPALLIGTFDTPDALFQGLEEGTILFGIDQNPFVQGYMPVWLLTLLSHTKQHLQNNFIETGPSYVDESPSEALQVCVLNDFEVCPRPVQENKNQLTRIRPLGLALAAVSLALSTFFGVWVWLNMNRSCIKKSQPLFLGMICIGTFLMASTIIPLGIDDSIVSPDACSRACMAAPWIFSIGFTTAFTALFCKIWRINILITSSQSFRRVNVTAMDVMKPFAILLTLNVIFLLVWTIVDPMEWERNITSSSADSRSSYGICVLGRSGVSTAMISCLLVVGFCVIVLANYQAYKARRISVEFSESKYVAMCMVVMLQVLLIGIPLSVLVSEDPVPRYFVMTAIIFILTMSLLLLIFVPKMHFVNDEKKGRRKTNSTNVSGLRIVKNPHHQSGLSKKQVNDLENVFKEAETYIGDTTELETLLTKAGINIQKTTLSKFSAAWMSSQVNRQGSQLNTGSEGAGSQCNEPEEEEEEE